MGWLGDLLKKAVVSESSDLIFVDGLPPPPGSITTVRPDEAYVELYVDSLRIEKARSFGTRFNGVVYSFVSLSRQGEERSIIAAVTKPAKLADLDRDSVGKVITVSRQMMGAVPWRGGALGLELGLFSVKAGNLLTPIINFVTKVSETAGISFVGAVKPFIPLITEGMDLIAGQSEDTRLEVGLDTSISFDRPMTCAIIAAKRGSIDLSSLSIDPVDRKLLAGGEPVKAGYCVFSLRATDRKADFGEVPALKEGFAAFRKAVLDGVEAPARDALAAFRRAAILSPDLITADATKLIASAEAMMRGAFASGTTPAGDIVFRGGAAAGGPLPTSIPASLADVPLYR